MAKAGPKDADYIHVEIYKDFAKHEVNAAARQWVIRPNAASVGVPEMQRMYG